MSILGRIIGSIFGRAEAATAAVEGGMKDAVAYATAAVAAVASAAAEPVDPNAIKMSITRPTGEVLVHPTAATGAPQS